LRLFFEQKLNTLHHVNRELTTKYKNLKVKYGEELAKTIDLTTKNTILIEENNQLKDHNANL